VSCPSASACTGAGEYSNGFAINTVTLAEHWNR
jgi:hypothetical protein